MMLEEQKKSALAAVQKWWMCSEEAEMLHKRDQTLSMCLRAASIALESLEAKTAAVRGDEKKPVLGTCDDLPEPHKKDSGSPCRNWKPMPAAADVAINGPDAPVGVKEG